WIVGNAGVLVARVLHVKDGVTRRFAVVDAAMNDLMRPALYDAWHEIVPVREPSVGDERSAVDIVGPICESTDTFAAQRQMPATRPGDLVAFLTAGAYGAVMSSAYNSRLLVPEAMVRGAEMA